MSQVESYLSFCFLFFLQLLLVFLHGFMVLACFESLSVGGHARSRAERLLGVMPVFSCGSEKRKALATVIFEGQGKKSGVANFIPFFRMPLMGAAAEGAEDMRTGGRQSQTSRSTSLGGGVGM